MTTTHHSRRNILKATGLAVVGWSVAGATWATPATAAELGPVPVPRLDGTLELSTAARTEFSTDFGRLITAQPKAVLRPGSVQDIVKMLQYCRRFAIQAAMNGQSGNGERESHSNYGQALTRGGMEIDANSLSRIIAIRGDHAVVEPGVSWASLTKTALNQGATPPSLTDYLHLSIGGTVSVGGIGGGVQRHGLQSDTVKSMDIVTGAGELVTATPTRNADLFNAALAGGGQVGVIVKLVVGLIPARQSAEITTMYYEDLDRYLEDQKTLMNGGRFQHQAGEISRRPDNSGWRYKIEVGSYFDAGSEPDHTALLSGMGDLGAERASVQMPFVDWAFRLDPFEAYLKEIGYWEAKKPWLSLILPGSRVKEFVESVVPELTPDDLGAGFCLLSPFDRTKVKSPMFAMPETGDDTLYFFDLLCFPAPDATNIDAQLKRNRRLYERAVKMQGKRYIIGAIPGMTAADWAIHFGPREYRAFAAQKRKYDPSFILAPGHGFFGIGGW
ncbi:FAD-binding protein [Arthrobacter sp. H5]|uniref:FAD-binding protein n=1 Tax=Arthrobacter sp. H5 TaxID=1267973 RepID=UPI000486A86C|nr:FAD-binding protein [Arthrobacter sp. H5]